MTKQPEAHRYEFEGGKYVAFASQGTCTVTRHGELWRDLTGDKFVGCLFDEIDRLHEVNEDLLKTMRQLACLGNGDQYGNSDGNIIAQVALNKATGETE
jgi:hypothetical protein